MPSGVRSRGHGDLDGRPHRLGPVGHHAHLVDDDIVPGQELSGERPGGVLALPVEATIGDGDDRALNRLGQRMKGLLDDLGGGLIMTGTVGGLTHETTVMMPPRLRTVIYYDT